jgi:hypothetical protein
MEQIQFDPTAGPLRVNIEMGGVAFISYQLGYWSSHQEDLKLLVNAIGNNQQPHDDSFPLVNPQNPFEPLINHRGRIVEVVFRISGATSTASPYQAEAQVFQKTGPTSSQEKRIGTVPLKPAGSIGINDGPHVRTIVIKLV